MNFQSCGEIESMQEFEFYGGIKMECLRCKEKMFNAKLKGDAVGTVVYLTNKKDGLFETQKNSLVSCYVCPKCGYIELNADNAKNLIL
jgi:hypothetical protein